MMMMMMSSTLSNIASYFEAKFNLIQWYSSSHLSFYSVLALRDRTKQSNSVPKKSEQPTTLESSTTRTAVLSNIYYGLYLQVTLTS